MAPASVEMTNQAASKLALIDAEAHVAPPSVDALLPYLDDHWREYISHSAFKGAPDTSYPKGLPTTARPGATPPNGVPGSDLALMQAQVLDPLGVEAAILTCTYAVESIHNPDAAAAMAAAVNDWMIAEWLDRDTRLRGTLVVPSKQPEMAAQEIERLGDHPGIVQVFLPVRSEAPYGNRRYHPIFAAAARHDLVVGLHYGGSPGNPPTPSGWPSYYIEEYVDMSTIFQSQTLNLIVEGVFERFPTLRVSLLESGVTWLPSWMWRIDKEWKGLRREIPWSRRLPSETIRERMRLTIAPLDAPPNPVYRRQILDSLGSDDILLYASDYPHGHTTADLNPMADGQSSPVDAALGIAVGQSLARKIAGENARAWYRNL